MIMSRIRYSDLHYTVVLFVTIALGCAAPPDEATQDQGADLQSGGVTEVANAVVAFDAGNVFLEPLAPEGWRVSHEFVFHNASHSEWAALKLKKRTCGCTTCQIPDESVPPGGSALILMEYDVPYVRSRRSERVTIDTSLEHQPQLDFVLTAEIFPRMSITPHNAIRRSIRPGQSETVQAEVITYEPQENEEQDLEISMVGPGMRIADVGPKRATIRDGIRKTVVPMDLWLETADTANNQPRARGGLIVSHNGLEIARDVEIAVRPYVSAPHQLFIQRAAEHETPRIVTLAADERFEVLSVESDVAAVKCTHMLDEASGEHNIAITLAENVTSGPIKGSLVVHTNHPLQSKVIVPLYIIW